jgi:SAM-dependent methyltransferase
MNWRGHLFGAYRRLATAAVWPVLAYEDRRPPYAGRNERGVEWAYAMSIAAGHEGTTALDVGAGWTAWPYMLAAAGYRTTAIDWWTGGFAARWGGNRHWRVLWMDITNGRAVERLLNRNNGPFDLVTCISTLEHLPISDATRAMKNMERLLAPGGSLITTFPYGPRRSVAQERPFAQVYSDREIARFQAASGLRPMDARRYSCWSGGRWRAGPRREVCRAVPPLEMRKADLICIVWKRRERPCRA